MEEAVKELSKKTKRDREDTENGFGEHGGYMEAKITKLEEQFLEQSKFVKISDLFAGISIFVNGYTTPSSEELKRIMMQHGGIYHNYKRPHTKFFIANNVCDVKIRNKSDWNTDKFISAKWIVDCLKENRLLDSAKYLLYTNQKVSQPKLQFQKKTSSNDFNDEDVEKDQEYPLEEDSMEPTEADMLKDLELFNSNIMNSSLSGLIDSKSNPESISTGNSARTATDPNFLTEFFNNSRLHHIATLGAGFKQYISELRRKNPDRLFPDRELLKNKLEQMENTTDSSTKIMHIDMDCFFVSVGLKKHPHLKGHPVAVTHSKGGNNRVQRSGTNADLEISLYKKRLENKFYQNPNEEKYCQEIFAESKLHGINDSNSMAEIASCSYEAREMGLKNGMFVGAAMKLCPDLKTIPYDFEEYKNVAFTLYNTLAKYTLDIEAVSCDEMFVDLTEMLKECKIDLMDFVSFIRDKIKNQTGCACSAGIGQNRLQARLATKKAKPDGQFHLNPEVIENFMRDIPITELPGVGRSTDYQLRQLNWSTCGDLQALTLSTLQKELGKKFGETLHKNCRGQDDRELVYDQVRKSVSVEVNYGIRFTELSEVDTFLKQLCKELVNRLSEIGKRGKLLTLKLMVRSKDAPVETLKFMGHGVCDHSSKSISLSAFTDELIVIERNILNLFHGQYILPSDLRGIGVQLSKFEENTKSNVLLEMFKKVETKNQQNLCKKDSIAIVKVNESLPVNSSDIGKVLDIKSTPKKRGRPAKTSFVRNKSNGNISVMFNSMIVKKKEEDDFLNAGGLDQEVLAQLPSDIREEVLKDYQRHCIAARVSPKKKTEKQPEIILLEDSICDPKSPTKHIRIIPKISPDNIFLRPDRHVQFEAWLAQEPNDSDITVLSEFGAELIRTKRLNELFDTLKFLYRIIRDIKSCKFHRIYLKVVEILQLHMQEIYQTNLFVLDDFGCRCFYL